MNITVKDLLDAGVHFGHQVRRFNPLAKPFVFDHRHGVSIIDLEKTYQYLGEACEFLENHAAAGKTVLFVGTKKQAQELVRDTARECNMPFCANRWLGGALTNYTTVKASIEKYRRYLEMEENGELSKLPGKEASAIMREMSRMLRNFEGMKDMNKRPDALIVVDVKAERIAVAEANRMGIPVVGIVDTNADPRGIDYPIPANDDAVKSIRIVLETMLESLQNGLSRRVMVSPDLAKPTMRVEIRKDGEDIEPEVNLSADLKETAQAQEVARAAARAAAAEAEAAGETAEGAPKADAKTESAETK